MNNSRLFRLSRIVIAFTAASGMMINTAYATYEAKAATQYTQQVNQNYAKSLPFSDRQDFDDAQRGFIAPLLDEGILRDANGKIYYRANDYKFDINAAAPETVNPVSYTHLDVYKRQIILSKSGHACRPRMEKRHLSGQSR